MGRRKRKVGRHCESLESLQTSNGVDSRCFGICSRRSRLPRLGRTGKYTTGHTSPPRPDIAVRKRPWRRLSKLISFPRFANLDEDGGHPSLPLRELGVSLITDNIRQDRPRSEITKTRNHISITSTFSLSLTSLTWLDRPLRYQSPVYLPLPIICLDFLLAGLPPPRSLLSD